LRNISNIESSFVSFSISVLTFHLFDSEECTADAKCPRAGHDFCKELIISDLRRERLWLAMIFNGRAAGGFHAGVVVFNTVCGPPETSTSPFQFHIKRELKDR